MCYTRAMSEPARTLDPDRDDEFNELAPPLTDDERAAVLEGLAAADVSPELRASILRDLAAL